MEVKILGFRIRRGKREVDGILDFGLDLNTDGFDPLNSTRVVIRRAHIANGDDGVAVKDGCRDVVVE
ncbi:MAG: hypothetical protein EBV53_04525, partial [Proteobacteria bacterium]|nr:hypothetical protein [Pseudomonadota bacterium]